MLALLLVWVTFKPILLASPAWLPQPSVKLNWVEALRPRRLGTIGVALEHDQADAEILNRALGLAQTQNGQSELVLLHVVDTPITRVLGAETADRESGADERYLAELVAALKDRGYKAARSCCTAPIPPASSSATSGKTRSTSWSSARTGTAWSATCSWARPSTRSATAWAFPMLIARPDRGAPAPDPTASPATGPPSSDGSRTDAST